jgi:hypothetical protein
MLSISKTIKAIEQLFIRSGRHKPTISLPLYRGSSRSFKYEQSLPALVEHLDGNASPSDDNPGFQASVSDHINKDEKDGAQRHPGHPASDSDIVATFKSRLNFWRKSNFDGRFFYNVSALMEWMKSEANETQTNLDLLLLAVRDGSTALRTFPLTRRHIIDSEERSVLVFSVLLSQNLGQFIDTFWSANVKDSNMDNSSKWLGELRERFLSLKTRNQESIIASFQENIWAFIPVQLDLRLNGRFERHHVLPFRRKELINEKGGMASVFRVCVQEENLSLRLLSALRSSRYLDSEFGVVSQRDLIFSTYASNQFLVL